LWFALQGLPCFPRCHESLKPILYAGALCGVLDITAACINARIASGATPARVLQSVAGGLLGRSAYEGGFATAALGLTFHLVIALSGLRCSSLPIRPSPFSQKSRVFNGVAYGLLIWLTMNLLVVPMSRIPARPFVLQNPVTGMLILIVMVGMPVAFIVPKYYLHRQHRAHSNLLAETVHD
jgi:hypothetical protein